MSEASGEGPKGLPPKGPPKERPKKAKKKAQKEKVKKPKKIRPRVYRCYNEGCTEEFGQWKLARDHMMGVHETKDPKIKRSLTYLDTKSNKQQQGDTFKLRENPKVLATAPHGVSGVGHRGNDLGIGKNVKNEFKDTGSQ